MSETGRESANLYRCLICEQIIALKQGARCHVSTVHEDVSDSAAEIEPVDDFFG
jgi:hypothetical protein